MFIFSVNNSISFNSLAIEEEEDVEFSDGLNGSIFIGVLIGFATGEEELFEFEFEFKFDINGGLFEVVFIGFATKEGDDILLLKVFILLLFEGIKGFK
jgi:hypothetical protein